MGRVWWSGGPVAEVHTGVRLPRSMVVVSNAEPYEEPRLHLFTVDDARLWEFRSRLSDEEFAIADVPDEEWEAFHMIIAEG